MPKNLKNYLFSFLVSIKLVEKWPWVIEFDWFCAKFACLSKNLTDSLRKFCIDVKAAIIAGAPKPCEIKEKCVKLCWISGSRTVWGRELHNGDLSWLSKSTNSLTICLIWKK